MVLAPPNKKAKLRRDREVAGVDVVYHIPNVEGIASIMLHSLQYYIRFGT